MGFERNYPVKIPSKQINKGRRFFSTLSTAQGIKMNPWFLTGFCDAEASFSILIQFNEKFKTLWRVKLIFAIGLHKKDISILQRIQATFGVGKIHIHGKNSVQYRVESIKDLQVIITHFDQFPLASAKISDYLLFKLCFNLVLLQEHLTKEGLLKLVEIKAAMNLGLPSNLKEAFPNAVQIDRPKYAFKGIPDPYWVAGFTSGDGSFGVKTASSTTNKVGSRVQLRFAIGLNIREMELIKGLAAFFNLNKEANDKYVYITNDSVHLQLVRQSDILDIIIPFFEKYPIEGIKALDFSDFKQVADLLKNKEHLILEGFNKILEIKAGMNRERD